MGRRTREWLKAGSAAVAGAALASFARNFTSTEKKIKHLIRPDYPLTDPQFERAMSQLLGPPIVSGNQVQPLRNGAEIFPAMLDAISRAKRTITFETYIYWSGEIARKFADALAAKARQGVKVHVLLDGFGCNCQDGEALRRMREAGVEVELYHVRKFGKVNNRTHRKLLVIDGRVGFTGGVGIADQWQGNADSSNHWRDSHYRVDGPVVAQMQASFLDNWMKTRAEVLHGEDYFPALAVQGPYRCQMFKSSPMEGSESARLMYLLSVSVARKSVRVANAYFIPDDLMTETLLKAVKRGVKIEVIIPGDYIDSVIVRHASRHRWGKLLSGGVQIFIYQPTMYHCKAMIIDEEWTTIGSANFDNRSFRLNDEANLNVLDGEFARQEAEAFEKDKQRSKAVSYDEWRRRPLSQKAGDVAASLVRSQA